MEDGISGGLQHHYKTCCEKGGCCGRRACMVQRWHHHGNVVFQTGGPTYDIIYDNCWLVVEQRNGMEEGSGIFIVLFVIII